MNHFLWLIVIFLFVLIGGCLLWLHRNARLKVLPEQQTTLLGGRGKPDTLAKSQAIPRLIWTYWHSPELPIVVKRCIEEWQRLNPDYKIEVLHAARLQEFLDDIPVGLERLNVAKQTDWIRLALLHQYGGIWLDASIILTQPLNWVEQTRATSNTEFVGFYLDGYTVNQQYPVIESWFLAAPRGSQFIQEWLALFRHEAIEGETADYLQRLHKDGRHAALTQKIGDPSYHTIHVAAQDVLQRYQPEAAPWLLSLLRAEDSAYWLQVQSRWKRRPLFARLLWARHEPQCWPMLIKLRGGERKKLEFWLRKKWYRTGSLIDQTLGEQPSRLMQQD